MSLVTSLELGGDTLMSPDTFEDVRRHG